MTKIEMIDETVFEILDILYTQGELQSTALVNKVKHVHKSTFSRLKLLQKHNLIFRRVDKDREVYYWISFSGRLVLESMRAIKEYSKEIELPNMR